MKIFALCSCFLAMQALALAAMTAARRASARQYLNPEDIVVAFAGSALVDGIEHPSVARVIRAHRNLLESLPLFYGLGLTYVVCGASYRAAPILFATFTLARFVHTIVYLRELQPFRTISYAIGATAIVGMAAMILRTVFLKT
jgi:uncharacterized MAPEG superfamily protein